MGIPVEYELLYTRYYRDGQLVAADDKGNLPYGS